MRSILRRTCHRPSYPASNRDPTPHISLVERMAAGEFAAKWPIMAESMSHSADRHRLSHMAVASGEVDRDPLPRLMLGLADAFVPRVTASIASRAPELSFLDEVQEAAL